MSQSELDLLLLELQLQINNCDLWEELLLLSQNLGWEVKITALINPQARIHFSGILVGVENGEYGCQLLLKTSSSGGGGTVFTNEVIVNGIEMICPSTSADLIKLNAQKHIECRACYNCVMCNLPATEDEACPSPNNDPRELCSTCIYF